MCFYRISSALDSTKGKKPKNLNNDRNYVCKIYATRMINDRSIDTVLATMIQISPPFIKYNHLKEAKTSLKFPFLSCRKSVFDVSKQ